VICDELLREAAGVLPRRAGIPDPVREARWLLAAAWGVPESRVLAGPEVVVPIEVAERFRDWVRRRSAGEPAEHLTGRCRFFGRDFEVSPAVLVPRPETELVVETALALGLSSTARVVDVGTGSGCVAVTLALERPAWRVLAVDTSVPALRVARANARGLGASVAFALSDLTTALVPGLDLVVANLPYIPTGELDELPVEVRRDPQSALDGGADGLDLVRRLMDDLGRLVRRCGGAVLELGEGQADDVAAHAASCGLAVARRVRDVAGVDRAVVVQPV
jgi:release factor glutamine methyltransferase